MSRNIRVTFKRGGKRGKGEKGKRGRGEEGKRIALKFKVQS
jgi:hypothetical protein